MIPSSSFSPSTNSRSDSLPREAAGDSSVIRPRNRRLISTSEQELVSTSETSTPSGSRAASPLPQKYPSRGGGNENGFIRGAEGRQTGGVLAVDGGRQRRAGGGFWDSGWTGGWSALQGIASSVLGGVDVTATGSKNGKTWGPELLPKRSDGGIGGGTTAEREAKVRRKKMARVLEGRDDPPNTIDGNGRLKHRNSIEQVRPGSSSQEDGEDALVYIHHVQPNDTLAGVILRYNCQPAVFRKANRFWPNDSIQIRKTVILPVDACAIKGRPCDPPSPDGNGVDLLAPTPGAEEPPSLSNGKAPWPTSTDTINQTSAEHLNETVGDNEEPWTHVRWVLLDNSPTSKPTQIARMRRKNLGYFPPRRRKSQTTLSGVSTPRASSDLSSFPPSSQSPVDISRASNPPIQARRTSNIGQRPPSSATSVPGSYFPPPNMIASQPFPLRSRRDSSSTKTTWMTGPGGVGTLGPSVRAPGPAKDSMNAWVTKHLPSLAIDNLPSTYAQPTSTARIGFAPDELASISESPAFNSSIHQSAVVGTGVETPLLGPNGLGIENAAAAVEGWIRRIAVKGVPGTPKGGPGRRVEEPDLIELLDGTGSDDGRGFELNPGASRIVSGGSGREDLEDVIRGRGRAGTRGKGGKSD